MPAASPAYSGVSGLVTSYATFLDWIDSGATPNPNLEREINIARADVNSADAAFASVRVAAINAYSAEKIVDPTIPDFRTWVRQNYPSFLAAQNTCIGANAHLDELAIKAYGPGYSVLQSARANVGINGARSTLSNSSTMAVKTGSVAPAGSQPVVIGGTNPPPVQSLVSTYAPSYMLEAFSQKYREWQQASVTGKNNAGGSITVNSKSRTYDYDHFGWSTGLRSSFGSFFSVFGSGSASSQTTSINTTSSDFELSVTFTGLNAFRIYPGLWWDNGSLVATHAHNLRPGAPDFFSENGSLACRRRSSLASSRRSS